MTYQYGGQPPTPRTNYVQQPFTTPPPPKNNGNGAVIVVVVVVLAVIVGGIVVMATMLSGNDDVRSTAASVDASSTVDPSLGSDAGGDIESTPDTADPEHDDETVSEDIEKERERDKVYWNLQDYEFLGYDPDGVYPGSGYFVDSAEGVGQCSTGWIVGTDQEPDKTYMLTAGHCGEVGDRAYFNDPDTDTLVDIGEFVWKERDSKVGGLDYGLIELYGDYDLFSGIPVDDSMQISGWRGADWVKENKPYTCRIGARMGLSCGEYIELESDYVYRYENISNSGDSGGAVWAQDPDTGLWYAVGVTSFIDQKDGTNAGSVTIEPVMEHFDFFIYGPGPS